MKTKEVSMAPERRGGKNFRVLEGGPGSAPAERIAPASAEAEEHVLACCLLDGSETIGRCLALRLAPKAFYTPANQVVYQTVVELYQRQPPVTLEMLAEELTSRRQLEAVGGLAYLLQVTGKIPTTAHAGYFIEKVREKWLQRELVGVGTEAVENAYGLTSLEGTEGLLEGLATKVSRMLDYARAGEATMQERAQAALARTLEELAGKVDRSRWLTTGLREFDARLGPFDVRNEHWLVGVAAVTSNGKSALCRTIADWNLEQGKKGLVFLLETSMGKWLELAAGMAARVNVRFKHELTPERRTVFEEKLRQRHAWLGERLWICDEVLPVESIVARIEEHARRWGRPDFVVVDHLHQMRSRQNFKQREPEVAFIANELKRVAKRVDTTIFAAMQLNRASQGEGKRRPEKHDIRNSGEIEQAADRLVMIHTPAEDLRGAAQTDNQSRVMVEIIQAKDRNGPIGHREFWFQRTETRFMDVREDELGGRPATKEAFKGKEKPGKEKPGKEEPF